MGGRLPDFMGDRGAPVYDRVRQEMLDVYRATDIPPFLAPRRRFRLVEHLGRRMESIHFPRRTR